MARTVGMGRTGRWIIIGWLLGVLPAQAQAPPTSPTLTGISPVAASRGTQVEITLTGDSLDGARGLMCRYSTDPALVAPEAGRGIAGEVVSSEPRSIRARITIAPDATPGLHEIRAICARGITNPEYLFVSQYPERPEQEPNNSSGQANPVVAPVVIAGAINGGEDHDCFRIDARKGDRLVFDVESFKKFAPREDQGMGRIYLDSFLSLRDAQGNELAYSDDVDRLDATLYYEFATAGTYTLVLRDNLYRGRGDFLYRLTIGSRPTITAVYPAGGQRGRPLPVTVYGFNLNDQGATQLRTTVSLPARPGGSAVEFRVQSSGGVSNAVPLAVGNFLEAVEQEPNDRITDATRVILPAVINGRADSIDDVDVYRFNGSANTPLVVEIQAARFGSRYDSYLTLADTRGAVLANDDDGGGMPDARLQIGLPRTDEYLIRVRNVTRTGAGPGYFYRLTIRTTQPRFAVDNPGSVAVKQGGETEVTLRVRRIEDQTGDIQVIVSPPPHLRGISADPAVVKNEQNEVKFKILCAAEIPVGTYLDQVMLRVNGMAGNQPQQVEFPLWLTVAPP